MLSRFTTSSFRAARPQPLALLQIANLNLLAKIPMSISSPTCQCQSPRQHTNVNLLANMPISISSPKCQCQPPRQTVNVNPFAKMHHPRALHSFSVSLPPDRTHSKLSNPWHTSSAVPPRLDFESHSTLPISARNTSIEPYLARSVTHRPSN